MPLSRVCKAAELATRAVEVYILLLVAVAVCLCVDARHIGKSVAPVVQLVVPKLGVTWGVVFLPQRRVDKALSRGIRSPRREGLRQGTHAG